MTSRLWSGLLLCLALLIATPAQAQGVIVSFDPQDVDTLVSPRGYRVIFREADATAHTYDIGLVSEVFLPETMLPVARELTVTVAAYNLAGEGPESSAVSLQLPPPHTSFGGCSIWRSVGTEAGVWRSSIYLDSYVNTFNDTKQAWRVMLRVVLEPSGRERTEHVLLQPGQPFGRRLADMFDASLVDGPTWGNQNARVSMECNEGEVPCPMTIANWYGSGFDASVPRTTVYYVPSCRPS